jgi:uncharacterized membrane protein YgcG/tetratricopeptide (TPR) repeat protein
MKLPLLNQRAIVLALVVALTGFFWLCASDGARAQENAQEKLPKPNGHVNDFAEVLDPATRERLEKVLAGLEQRTGMNFVIATVKSSGSEELYDYSLRMANDWQIGVPNSPKKSILLVVAGDNGKFLAHITKGARLELPDGLVGDMGQRMRAKIAGAGYSEGLLTGVKTFADGMGERNNFAFSDLDRKPAENLIAEQQRPRTVSSPVEQATETPAATATETPARSVTETAVAKPSETAAPQPTETPKPEPAATVAAAVESPQPTATPEASVAASPADTPAVATPSPSSSPQPIESQTPQAAPSPATEQVAANSTRTTKPPVTDRKTTSTATADPEDEKEEVEVTLALPPEKRITTLKAFIAAHPQSVAVPRANELIVVAHAMLGDQKLQTGDVNGGLQQFSLAISEAPADMTDRLFTEIIARIPANLFLRGQGHAAVESAKQTEALAKGNPKRLAAIAGFYLLVEDANEAGRVAELAVAAGPDSAVAHQALGEARHIGLRLDEAETEFARALTLDPKLAAARLALADMKRAAGKFSEALMLYREEQKADPKSNLAVSGLVVALLELGQIAEADAELNKVLADKDQARNLPLLVGAGYWFVAHNDPPRGLELADKAVNLEPRYAWGQIALARALIANRRPQDAERSLRFARQFGRFPTMNYELANLLASMGLFDDAAAALTQAFTIKDGQIEAMLAGRNAARAATFTELLAPERRAVIFQPKAADTEANARMLKGLLALNTALNQPAGRAPKDDELATIAKDFTSGDDPMRAFRQIYVAEQFVKKNLALSTVVGLMDQAMSGVEAALSAPAATLAVQPDEYSDLRARALAQGGTPRIPDAPRAALSGLLRARIEDLAGMALYKQDKPAEAVARLRRAVNSSPEGTPLWRSSMWHLGAALEATGKNDDALPYYIKSYKAGPPDPARRSVIESVYKKVNGSLEGLDDKIGPGTAAANAPPSPSPK